MRTYLGICVILVIVDCSPRVVDILVHSGPCTAAPEGIRFEFEQPLYRKRRTLSIRTTLEIVNWKPEPPWNTIRLPDGRRVAVAAELEAENGTIFRSTSIAYAGDLVLRFTPPPPRNLAIKAVTLRADITLRCRDVRWFEFNAL